MTKKSGMELWPCRNRREKNLFQLVCGNAIAEIEGKKIVGMNLWQWHCRNRMKKKILPIDLWQYHCRNKGVKKKIWAIVAIPLPKMGRRKKNGFRNSINVAVAFVLVVFLFH